MNVSESVAVNDAICSPPLMATPLLRLRLSFIKLARRDNLVFYIYIIKEKKDFQKNKSINTQVVRCYMSAKVVHVLVTFLTLRPSRRPQDPL